MTRYQDYSMDESDPLSPKKLKAIEDAKRDDEEKAEKLAAEIAAGEDPNKTRYSHSGC